MQFVWVALTLTLTACKSNGSGKIAASKPVKAYERTIEPQPIKIALDGTIKHFNPSFRERITMVFDAPHLCYLDQSCNLVFVPVFGDKRAHAVPMAPYISKEQAVSLVIITDTVIHSLMPERSKLYAIRINRQFETDKVDSTALPPLDADDIFLRQPCS